MNSGQVRHVKSMARHIREHAQAIVMRLEAVEADGLEEVPLDALDPLWKDVRSECGEIEQVLCDMTPHLKDSE